MNADVPSPERGSVGESRRPAGQPSSRSRWAIAAVSLIVSLTFVEAWLRALDRRDHERLVREDPNREFCAMRSDEPGLIYTYVPSRPGCETNSHGYRDHEHAYEKPRDTFRIAVIGDSVAEGWGVPLEATFSRVVERQAPKRMSKRVETVILARQGYSTSQELVLLRKEAPNYHPDLIVWSYVLNDPADPIFHNANSDTARYFFRPHIFLLQRLRQAAFNVREAINGRSCDREFHAFLHCAHWKDVEKNVADIGEFARRRGVPVIFLIHPIFEPSAFDRYSLMDLHRRLAELATAHGFVPLDGLNCYRGHSSDELRLHRDVYDPWHPNVLGHDLIGHCLIDAITRLHGLRSQDPRITGNSHLPS